MLSDFILDAKTDETPINHMRFENETLIESDISRIDFNCVHFVKCRFAACDFTRVNFYDSRFEDCDISNCKFSGSYWKGTKIVRCKAAGSDFGQSSFKEVLLDGCSFHYANCVKTTWANCEVKDSQFKEAFMSEAKLKTMTLSRVDFTRVDFFKTPLKGIDLSDCIIEGILLSDTYAELRGAKINMLQAANIAQILGVQIV